jgi:hypothetical protein
MPYKERLKKSEHRIRKKAGYKVLNWSDYNKSLKKRGQLSFYFPKGELKSLFINEETYQEGLSGRQAYYRPAYIELIYIFYRLFNWGMRQIIGYFEDFWKSKGLDIAVPSFGHLSDLFASLPAQVRHYCDKVAQRLQKGESVSLIMDSSGFSFDKARYWYQTKYNKPCEQRPWRKLHLSMDADMETYAVELTEQEVSDREVMDLLTPASTSLDKVIADGGYYSAEKSQDFYDKGIIPVIPPPASSVVHNQNDLSSWHDKIVSYIQEKGTVYAFHKKYGYGIRSKIEAQFSRIKRCIGSSLKTIRIDSQKREAIIIGNILNLWNSFGKPVSVKIP